MKNKSGNIFLIGAGPGDKGLITLNALDKLKIADVVVYDRLINDELLTFCKDDCEKIFVGKESGYHPIEQEKITEILINKSKQGKTVIRLKGGNPFIFGRGSEEALELKKEGINFEIIPGITSGLAAPVYCGIPITQRGVITQCVFITAHECPDKPGTQVEWEKLAKLKNTSLIIYMGASRIETISKTLIKYGMDPSTPAAAIENATLPVQRTLTARLDEIAEKFKEENFHAPVIIMISPTISLRKDICWFEKKPLFNKRIAIAGSAEQRSYYYNLFSELGADILYLPVMKIKIKNEKFNLRNRFRNSDFEWILFTKELAVKYFFDIIKRENLDSRIFGEKRIAAIGSRTTEILKSFNIIADFNLPEFETDSFQNNYIKEKQIAGKKILRIQNEGPFDKIQQHLNNSNVNVEELNIYSVFENALEEDLITKLNEKNSDIFIFSDPSSIDFLFNELGTKKASEILLKSKSVIVDPATPDVLLEEKLNQLNGSKDFKSINIQEFVSKLV
jgi:uroporphyrinogen III methyltransferase/synthase